METNAIRNFNWRVKTIKIYSLNHGFLKKSMRKHNLFIVEYLVGHNEKI